MDRETCHIDYGQPSDYVYSPQRTLTLFAYYETDENADMDSSEK